MAFGHAQGGYGWRRAIDLDFAGGGEVPAAEAYVRVQTSVGDRIGAQRVSSCIRASVRRS